MADKYPSLRKEGHGLGEASLAASCPSQFSSAGSARQRLLRWDTVVRTESTHGWTRVMTDAGRCPLREWNWPDCEA